jgi:hypothetical protein
MPKLLSSPLLESFKNLTHAFSTRHGGVSPSPFSSFNLAFHVGDNPLHVNQNHELLASALGYKKSSLVHMRQIHSDIVHIVSEDDDFEHPPQCDALITNKKNIPLMIMSADCAPIIIYDPLLHVIAVVHAGREGAFKNIIAKTIAQMQEHFTCKPASLHVSLGASIHGCCYEVNENIANEAKALGYQEMLSYKNSAPFLHVNTIVKKQLEETGVKQIDEIALCSACHHETFFSYRADGGITGRTAAVAMLR